MLDIRKYFHIEFYQYRKIICVSTNYVSKKREFAFLIPHLGSGKYSSHLHALVFSEEINNCKEKFSVHRLIIDLV